MKLRLLSYILISLGLLHAETITIQQKSSGKSLEVTLLELLDEQVKFESQGREFTVPLRALTDASTEKIQTFFNDQKSFSDEIDDLNNAEQTIVEPTVETELPTDLSSELEEVNNAIGHSLFGTSDSLWSETAEKIAKRLNWRLESRKVGTSSYRLYTSIDYQFLGAHPYCVTLYGGAEDSPERFSLVYANKGDFGSRLGVGENHFRQTHPEKTPPGNLEEAIEMDKLLVRECLTNVLGEASTQYYGEKEDKRKVERWDVKDHSFLLSAKDDEYVHLLIVPTSDADAQGKVKFVKDADLKKNQLKNVTTNDNGDVWVDNIPMVDQGPKGYCAPATFERAMRYMQVPADMYLLATAATTQEGTNTRKLADDCKRIVRSKARRIKELSLHDDFEIKSIKKFIDKGVPVLWTMCSLGHYNDIANTRTKEREEIGDIVQWSNDIAAEAEKAVPRLGISANHHICMIIGYNETTREVAVSDSWGPRYEIRWVHEEIARAVTSRGGFVIDF